MLRGVIFDVDGTMVDNMMLHHRLWHQKLNELGLNFTLEETMEKAHGVNIEFLRRFFGTRFTDEQLHQISAEKEAAYRTEMKRHLPLVEGVVELIKALHREGISLAVGSAGPPDNVHFVLKEAGLQPYFPVVYHSGNVTRGKPNPQVYLNGARDLGLSIRDCLVIEDTPIGAQTAANAGCPVLVVTTTHRPKEFAHLANVVDFVPDFQSLDPDKLRNYFVKWHHETNVS
ncbi:MAG: HAD family phosphatase [Saprospiraceae bacterium]|nr:HAD family phosphatase [Saprospiraceae bacterium]